MGACRAFLVGLIFVAVASAQQPCGSSISAAPTYNLAGKVVAPSGAWIQIYGPQIIDSVEMEKVLFTPCFFDTRSGAFAFRPLPAGTYTVRVAGMSAQHVTIFTTHKLVLSSDATDVQLELRPGASIPVRVRKESPHAVGPCWWNPLAEMFHSADCSDYRAARVNLVPVDSKRRPYTSGAGWVEDPVNFTVEGIEPGKYVVQVELPSFPANYVQSLRSGNIDLLHEPLSVPEFGSVLPIDIVLRDDFARIKAHTNRTEVQPLIVLLPQGVLLPVPQLARTNGEKELSFVLAPGSYSVFAFAPTEKLIYNDLELLTKYAARATHVTVSARETRSINLDVIHLEE